MVALLVGFNYFDQYVQVWFYDGVVALLVGFTYLDRCVQVWVYDGVVDLLVELITLISVSRSGSMMVWWLSW